MAELDTLHFRYKIQNTLRSRSKGSGDDKKEESSRAKTSRGSDE